MRRFGREFQSIRLPRNGCRTYSRGLTTPTAQWLAKKPVCPRERGEESRAGRGAPMLSSFALTRPTLVTLPNALAVSFSPLSALRARLKHCSPIITRGSGALYAAAVGRVGASVDASLDQTLSPGAHPRSIISIQHSSWLDAAFHVKTSSSLDCCNEISSSPASAWPDEAKRKLK
jgi:hypothetical protein